MSKTEIRFETDAEDVAVLDGYCAATGRARTEVLRELLAKWSEARIHEATIILRVAGRIPTLPESDRSPAGKGRE